MTVPSPENKTPDTLPQEKVDIPAVQTTPVDTVNTSEPEKPEDPNWRAFREARKQDRLQREAAEKKAAEKEAEVKALKEAMEAAFAKGNTPNLSNNQTQYSGYVEEETEDQRIEKKVQLALAQREQAAALERQRREQEEYPQRLQQHFPDFQQAIANENLDYLDYHYPEVSAPLKRLPDGYDKWHDIYKAIKKFIPNTNHKKDAQKAENNFNKPRSMSSAGMTQTNSGIAQPHILSKEQKEANWARMQKARMGLS